MNNLKILPIDMLKYPIVRLLPDNCGVLWSFERCFSSSVSLKIRRKLGRGKDQGKMAVPELYKIVENEKRGIFRKLDIGLPEPFNPEKKKFNDRIIVKAAPRLVLLNVYSNVH